MTITKTTTQTYPEEGEELSNYLHLIQPPMDGTIPVDDSTKTPTQDLIKIEDPTINPPGPRTTFNKDILERYWHKPEILSRFGRSYIYNKGE